MSLKFCLECSSMMTKSTSTLGTIVFQCRCQITIDGTPDDTLMAEEFFETAESNLKHEVFIENAPFDLAGHVVLKDCPKCNLNFMVMIRVGTNESTLYSCRCGFRASHTDYTKIMSEKPSIKEVKVS